MNKKKRDWPLIIGISIPFLMILAIVLSIFIPRMFIHPETDFIYAANAPYYYTEQIYRVENGEVVRDTSGFSKLEGSDYDRYGDGQIYYYDVSEDTADVLTFEAAQEYNLNKESPEGLEVGYGRRSDSLFFSVRDRDSIYLYGKGYSKKLNIDTDYNRFNWDFHFIGWVIE